MTPSIPNQVSLLATPDGDKRIVDARDKTVGKAPTWIEKNTIELQRSSRTASLMVGCSSGRSCSGTPQY